jgi:hypothetical protein
LGGAFKTDFVVLSLVYIAEATIIATLSMRTGEDVRL